MKRFGGTRTNCQVSYGRKLNLRALANEMYSVLGFAVLLHDRGKCVSIFGKTLAVHKERL